MIFSIGHSNHELEQFLELLKRQAIDVLVDVRSSPYSAYSTQFNRELLQASAESQGVRYLFMGDLLGGRPEGQQFYDPKGHVLYHRVAVAEFFERGIQRLCEGSRKYRLAMMCSEEDPTVCHRLLLVSRVLEERGQPVTHIRGDGRLQSAAELRSIKSDLAQGMLFPELEEESWKSLRSVLPKAPPPAFSED